MVAAVVAFDEAEDAARRELAEHQAKQALEDLRLRERADMIRAQKAAEQEAQQLEREKVQLSYFLVHQMISKLRN